MADESGFDNVAYFIGGGAEHSPELMRFVPYALSGGAEGIVTPGDLKVSQMPQAAGRVRMAPGGAILLNREVQDARESYLARAPRWSYVDIPPTGSTGRSDLVGVVIKDPQYEGWADPPTEEAARNWPYAVPFRIPNVSPTLASFADLGFGYAAYGCSIVSLPPNTTAVTDAMCRDIRELAMPSYTRFDRSNAVADNLLIETDWVRWPAWNPTVKIPKWCTWLSMTATILGAAGQGSVDGELRARIGGITGGSYRMDLDFTSNRETIGCTASGWVAAEDRGRTVELVVEGKLYAGSTRIGVNQGSQMRYEVDFFQYAV